MRILDQSNGGKYYVEMGLAWALVGTVTMLFPSQIH